jgi:hypothetical protein
VLLLGVLPFVSSATIQQYRITGQLESKRSRMDLGQAFLGSLREGQRMPRCERANLRSATVSGCSMAPTSCWSEVGDGTFVRVTI